MKVPQIQNLLVFCLVARSRSTRQVAEYLKVNITTVMRNITRLEKDIGMTLIRSNKQDGITLTEEGEMLYAKYARSVDYFEDMVEHTLEAFKEETLIKEMRILLPVAGTKELLQHVYFRRIQDVILKENKLNIDSITIGEVRTYPKAVIQKINNSDIAIIPEEIVEEIQSHYVAQATFVEDYYLCAAPQYLKDHSVTLDSYKTHIYCKTNEKYQRGDYKFVYRHPTSITVSDNEKLVDLLLAGNGVGVVSIVEASKYIKTGQLKVLYPHLYSSRHWYLIKKVHTVEQLNINITQACDLIKSYLYQTEIDFKKLVKNS